MISKNLPDSTFNEHLQKYYHEVSRDLVAYHEPNGTIQYTNHSYSHKLGYGKDDLFGRNFYDLLHPDDISSFEQKVHSPVLNGKNYGFSKARIRKSEGNYLWLNIYVIPVIEDSELVKLLSVSEDIDERQNLENRLYRQLKQLEDMGSVANIGRWEYDVGSGKIQWSSQVYKIHGLPEGQDVNLEEAMKFYEPNSRQIVEEAFNAAIETGKRYSLRLKFIPAAGDPIWVRAIGVPELQMGRCVKVFGIFQDITGDVENEHRELTRLVEWLSAKNARLREFSHIVSHDLRGPLSSLKLLTEEIGQADSDLDPGTIKDLIQQSVDLLLEKTETMVQGLDTVEEGPDKEDVDIEEVIEEALLRNRGSLLDNNIEVTIETLEWNIISYRKFVMQSVILNLISNASRFCDSEKSKSWIKIRSYKKSGKHYLRVKDNGFGMNLPDKEKTRFRIGQTFHHVKSGSGKGLFLVQTQVEANGGELIIDSEPGQGTIITIVFDKYE